MSQNYDAIITNIDISEYNTTPNTSPQIDKIGDIYDHLNALVASLANLSLFETFDISTKENALNSLQKINLLKLQIEEKIRILTGLKKVLISSN